MTDEPSRAVLLVGPVGAGKSTIAAELGELVAARGLPVAVIDLDWLGWFHGPPGAPTPDELIAQNLQAVWPHFHAAGSRYLVLARAVTTASHVAALKDALGGVEMKVVLVRASPGTIAARLARRDEGDVLSEHLAESASMAQALEAARLEDVEIVNDSRPAAEIAGELARLLGWT